MKEGKRKHNLWLQAGMVLSLNHLRWIEAEKANASESFILSLVGVQIPLIFTGIYGPKLSTAFEKVVLSKFLR